MPSQRTQARLDQEREDARASLAEDAVRRDQAVRNLKILLGVGGALALVGLGLWLAMPSLVMRQLTHSKLFVQLLRRAEGEPEVKQRLGTPLEAAWALNLESGQVGHEGGGYHIQLSVPIEGPKGSGKLVVTLANNDGPDNISVPAAYVLTDLGRQIDIMHGTTIVYSNPDLRLEVH